MGKKKATLSKPPQRMTRRERSRWQREGRIQRTLIIVLAAIGVVSILAVGVALYFDMAVIPNQAIIRVNGEPITQSEYWAARRLEIISQWHQAEFQIQFQQLQGITVTRDQYASQMTGILRQLTTVRREPYDQVTLRQLIRDKVLIQGARALGIVPTADEVDAWVLARQQGGQAGGDLLTTPTPLLTGTAALTVTAVPPATPTPPATLTPEERRNQLTQRWTADYEMLRNRMNGLRIGSPDFSAADYVAMIRHSNMVAYLGEKVKERLAEGLPKTEEQVWASHILLRDRSLRAQEAWNKLKSDPSAFAQIAVQYSDDSVTPDAPGSRDRAGDLGWLSPASPFYTDVVTAALRLQEPGEISPVITGTNGYHILQLVERDTVAGRVHVRHIWIPFDRRPQAEAALNLLQQGQTFSQVAKTYSEDESTAAQGGSLGTVITASLSPEVRAAVLLLTTTNPISSVSPIIEDSQGNYHIVKLLYGNPAGGTVNLQEILILGARRRAEQVRAKLGNKASFYDFSQAVVKYSAYTPTVELAGDIGTVASGGGLLPEEVYKAAQTLTVTSNLTLTRDMAGNYYILQLVGREDSGLHLRQILIKDAKALAEEIRAYIVAGPPETMGERFMEMATRFSDDTATRGSGGDMGWFGREAYPNLAEQVFDVLKDGEVSTVLEIEGEYHILWRREYDAAHPISQEVLNQRAQEKYDGWLNDLVAAAKLDPQPTPTLGLPTYAPPPTPTAGTP